MTENWCKYNVCSIVTDVYTVHIVEGFGITFYGSDEMANYKMFISLFHHAFRFTKFYLYQRMHLILSYTKIT